MTSLRFTKANGNWAYNTTNPPSCAGNYTISFKFCLRESTDETGECYFLGLSCDGSYLNGDIFNLTAGRQIRWSCYTDGWGNETTGGTRLEVDQVYDICIVRFDGTVTVYLDGVSEGSVSDDGGHPANTRGSTTEFYLNEYVGGGGYQGSIDIQAMKFWEGRGLTAAERSRESRTMMPSDWRGIYGVWPFLAAGSSVNLADASGKGHQFAEGGASADLGEHMPVQFTGARPIIHEATATSNDGALSATVSMSLSSAADLGIEGVATKTVSATLSAAADLGIEGASTLTVSASLSAAGSLEITGDLAAALTMALDAVGFGDNTADASIPITITLLGEGSLGIDGALTATIPITLSSIGAEVENEGELVATIPITLVASGHRYFALTGTEVHVLRKDFPNLVDAPPVGAIEVQIVRDADGRHRFYIDPDDLP